MFVVRAAGQGAVGRLDVRTANCSGMRLWKRILEGRESEIMDLEKMTNEVTTAGETVYKR